LTHKTKICRPRQAGAAGLKEPDDGWMRPLGQRRKILSQTLPKVGAHSRSLDARLAQPRPCGTTETTKNPPIISAVALLSGRQAVQNGTQTQTAYCTADTSAAGAAFTVHFVSKSLILEV
jgi:hypothetical protein